MRLPLSATKARMASSLAMESSLRNGYSRNTPAALVAASLGDERVDEVIAGSPALGPEAEQQALTAEDGQSFRQLLVVGGEGIGKVPGQRVRALAGAAGEEALAFREHGLQELDLG